MTHYISHLKRLNVRVGDRSVSFGSKGYRTEDPAEIAILDECQYCKRAETAAPVESSGEILPDPVLQAAKVDTQEEGPKPKRMRRKRGRK